MRIIKSKSYIKKEAIWSLPGDSNLPPGVSNKDIDKRFLSPEADIVDNQSGETEIGVDWKQFSVWYATDNGQLPNVFLNRQEPSTVQLIYTYSYDYNDGSASDIKPIKLLDYLTKKTFTGPDFLISFSNYYEDQIKSDIEIFEEDAKMQRFSDHDPLVD